MAATKIAHPSVDERRAKGKEARERTPLSAHSGWKPAADRPDPVALLEAQNAAREPDLVPVRHGRMMVSPFTFYRGAAKIMAADLDGDADGRHPCPTVRRRAPVELRGLRVAGARPAVRSQRLRRDPPRPLRVRRQTHGGELHDRGAQQRLLRQGRGSRNHAVGERVPDVDAGVRGDADDGCVALAPVGRRDPAGRAERGEGQARRQGGEGSREGDREGAHPGQPPGVVQARRDGRRALPDRESAPDRRTHA